MHAHVASINDTTECYSFLSFFHVQRTASRESFKVRLGLLLQSSVADFSAVRYQLISPLALLAIASGARLPPHDGIAEEQQPLPREPSSLTLLADKLGRTAFDGIIANIGPPAGADDGIVIASPSKGDRPGEPDYYYTWTRDSALTISTLLSDFLPSAYLEPWLPTPANISSRTDRNSTWYETNNALLEPLIRDYISAQATIQTLNTRSGDLYTGGLSEPKYYVNKTAFNGDWGRPQRDGPALRALAIIPYANFLLDRGWPADIAFVREHLYDPHYIRQPGKVVKNDLEEVAHSYQEQGFDLWEEVQGHHFWTLLSSARALQAGSLLAYRLNDPGAGVYYASQIEGVQLLLNNHLAGYGGWVATLQDSNPPTTDGGLPPGRSGLDCALPLSINHFGYVNASETDGGEYSPASPQALVSLHAYVQSFNGLYDINGGKNRTDGWAVGRYAEDIYNGTGMSKGNPWFICTYAVAEQLYRAHRQINELGEVRFDNTTLAFWAELLPKDEATQHSGTVVSLKNDKKRFNKILDRLEDVADAFMAVGNKSTVNGRMSEQISRTDGRQIGARDLTWSYAAYLDAVRARDKLKHGSN